MTINTTKNADSLTLAVEGRIDTVTAPALDEAIASIGADVRSLVLDMGKVEYISSSGLRTLLKAQKKMNKIGSLLLRNVSADVLEVLEITGFADILTIEK